MHQAKSWMFSYELHPSAVLLRQCRNQQSGLSTTHGNGNNKLEPGNTFHHSL